MKIEMALPSGLSGLVGIGRDALVVGAFVVHRAKYGIDADGLPCDTCLSGWVLTHLPSGLKAGGWCGAVIKSRESAVEYAKGFSALNIDWTDPACLGVLSLGSPGYKAVRDYAMAFAERMGK